MPNNTEQRRELEPGEQPLFVADQLLRRLVGIVSTIVWLGFLLVFGLVAAYVYLTLNPQEFSGASAASSQVQSLLMSIWNAVIPIAGIALRVVAPVVLILGVIVLLAYLNKRGVTEIQLSKFMTDLPSFLAILIIVTICLLPLSNLEVPAVLNNIALVVVGFYFGKREAVVKQDVPHQTTAA